MTLRRKKPIPSTVVRLGPNDPLPKVDTASWKGTIGEHSDSKPSETNSSEPSLVPCANCKMESRETMVVLSIIGHSAASIETTVGYDCQVCGYQSRIPL